MSSDLKGAWQQVLPGDLDQHLKNIGQAEVNGKLISEMLGALSLSTGTRVLIPGAGTGQMLDYCDTVVLSPLKLTFTEINFMFLTRIRTKLNSFPMLDAQVIHDDIESTNLEGPFEVICGILLLEHIDWELGLRNLISLSPRHVLLIVQQNENGGNVVTASAEIPWSIQKFSENAKPLLIDIGKLTDWLDRKGYELLGRADATVPNSKKMVGLSYCQK